jgi:hypothetical protein
VIVDDYSKYTWEKFQKNKTKTSDLIINFSKKIQNLLKKRIIKIKSDNGTEFKNSKVESFLNQNGITHDFSAPRTPQQNGVIERKTGLWWKLQELCLRTPIHQSISELKQLQMLALPNVGLLSTNDFRKLHMKPLTTENHL